MPYYEGSIDDDWYEKRYDEVLRKLLEEDSMFPEDFELEDVPRGSNLERFVERRNQLHKCIQEPGCNLDEIKTFTSHNESKFYFNHENKSAAFKAIEHKKFKIYAYLKTIGADLHDKEHYVMQSLENFEQNNLLVILNSFYPNDPKALILDLAWKSKSLNQARDFRAKMKRRYEEMYNKVPEILWVLHHYEKNLEINFELNKGEIIGVSYFAGPGCKVRGITFSDEKTIHIADQRKEEKILGTLAHELAHMAMETIFKNGTKPYGKWDDGAKKEFEDLTKLVNGKIKNLKGPEAEIVLRAFQNKEIVHQELIVRVPHIMVQFQNGENWLSINLPSLFNYYKEKIIPKCEKFVSERYLLKPRNMIRNFNENFGEINILKKCHLRFRQIDFLKTLLNRQNISFLITKHTRLSLFRVLKALHTKNYTEAYHNFIVLSFQDCVNKYFEDVKFCLFSEVTDSLVLECNSVDKELLKEGIQLISEELAISNKKIVLVIQENQKTIPEQLLQLQLTDGSIEHDEDFCLNDLEPDSKNIILEKEVIFHGKSMTLKNFGADEEFCKSVNSFLIGEIFLKNEKKRIGSEALGINSLEGFYAQILEEINVQSLRNEIKSSDHVFVFVGEKDELVEELEAEEVDLANYLITNKKILWTKEMFEFKNFCQINQCKNVGGDLFKKIYLISLNNECKTLLQIYNPHFYVDRKIRKVVWKFCDFEKKINDMQNETFAITQRNSFHLQNNYPNVEILVSEEAKKRLRESKKTIHWFLLKDDYLVFKDSNSCFWDIRRFMNETLSEKKLDDDKLIEEIIDEKVVIMAGEPGMGKSTTLTKLQEYLSAAEKYWMIRINVKDHLNAIKEAAGNNLTMKNVIRFLKRIEPNTSDEYILELVLNTEKTFPKDLLIIFDGFDELLDKADRANTIRLFKFLKTETKSKIWIASRLHYKNLLENELKTFAVQLDPIDKEEFIKKYYKDRTNLLLDKEKFAEVFDDSNLLQNYTDELIKKMESIFVGDSSEFFGTPLQLNLMLENSTKYFKGWLENSCYSLDFSYLGDGLFDVFEKYIERKYEVYFKKKQVYEEIQKMALKAQLELNHKNLALRKDKMNLQESDSLLLLVGLVYLQGGNLQFFHFTFREFYCARVIIDCITNVQAKFSELLLADVLTKPEYKLTRKFVDSGLSKILPNSNFESLLKNLKIVGAQSWMQNDESGVLKSEEYLHLNVLESNYSVFSLLFSNLKYYCKPDEYLRLFMLENSDGFNLLESLAVGGNPQICDLLLKTIEEMPDEGQRKIILMKRNYCRQTVFHTALKNNKSYVFKSLLKSTKKAMTLKEFEHFIAGQENDDGGNLLFLAIEKGGLETIENLLSEIEGTSYSGLKALMRRDLSCQQILLLDKQQNGSKVLKFLHKKSKELIASYTNAVKISEGSKCSVENLLFNTAQNRSVLLLAIRENNLEIINILLKEAETVFSTTNSDIDMRRLLFFLTFNHHLNGLTERIFYFLTKILIWTDNACFWFMIRQTKLENSLVLATRRNNNEIVELLLKQMEKIKMPLEDRKSFFLPSIYTPEEFSNSSFSLTLTHLTFKLTLSKFWYNILMIATLSSNLETALMLAIEHGDIEVCKVLLEGVKNTLTPIERKLFYLAKNNLGLNVFMLSMKKNNLEITKLLLVELKNLLPADKDQRKFLMLENYKDPFFQKVFNECDVSVRRLICQEARKLLKSNDFTKGHGDNYPSVFKNQLQKNSIIFSNILNFIKIIWLVFFLFSFITILRQLSLIGDP